jgi:Cu(I)/Ag(I) efflux system periplasmic protein CusF
VNAQGLGILATAAIAGLAPARAQDMANMPGMAAPASADAVRTGQGVGVIMAIDAAAHTLTLKHGPIPAIGWPAMTMTFKVEPSAWLPDLKVGQPVAFNIKATGTTGEITGLRPQS